MTLLGRLDLPADLLILALIVEMYICHSWLLDASCVCGGGVDLPVDLAIWDNRNLKLPFLVTRCLYWGVDLPVDMPIWAVTIEIWNCHSWPLDACTGGGVDLPVDMPIWAVTIEIWNCHSWPLDASSRG